MDDILKESMSILFNTVGQPALFVPLGGAVPIPLNVKLLQDSELKPTGFDSTVRRLGTIIRYCIYEIGRVPVRGETFTLTETGEVWTVQQIEGNDGFIVEVAVSGQ